MSDMSTAESIERFHESMKRAISRCRELAKSDQNADWEQVAVQLSAFHATGMALCKKSQMSKADMEAGFSEMMRKH